MNEAKSLTIYEPQNLMELKDFCGLVTKTKLVPPAYQNKQDDAMVAIMYGRETAGLGPLTSLQYVAVINGRPAFYSDAMPGIAFNKRLITDMEESFEGEPYNDNFTAVCVITRPSGTKVTQRFSVADAKKAGLWGKSGPWTQYPKRMLQWRARGWAIRDAAPHALFGMTVEEIRDVDEHHGPDNAKVINPEPQRPAQPLSAPALVSLYDQWGTEYLIEPGEVEQWIKDAIDGATEEELKALLENNADNAKVCEAVRDESEKRVAAATEPPPPSGEHAESRPPAATTAAGNGRKTAKQRAQEIAQAIDGAPDLDELLKLETRLRDDIARLPDIAKSRIAAIFHAKRGELQKPAAGEPSFHDELDAMEDPSWREGAEAKQREWTQEEGRVDDPRQPELLG